MILPSKHISENQCLLGVGAIILRHLERPQTITSLWNKVRIEPSIGNFERFVLTMDLLHIIGMVNISHGFLQRESP